MDLKLKAFVTVTSILAFAGQAHAGELARGDQVKGESSGVVLSVGQCVLSVQRLYKRVTAGPDEMTIIPLEEAKRDPGCPGLRDYSEVESAYTKHGLGARRIAANTNAVFTRDTTNSALREAYRDPSGLIWGEVIKDHGKTKYMSQYDADKYCKAGGARLPTREEFRQLAKYLGDGSARGYSPYLADGKTDVLPGLSDNWFWSSSVLPIYSDFAYGFDGDNGDVGNYNRNYVNAVRCVSGR